MTSAAFDTLITRSDAPLIVVTVASHDQRAGCLVGFHSQCSIDPVRYAVWLSKANFTCRVALFATHLALHFLDPGDHALAQLFGGTTGDQTEKFALCDWTPGPGGVPLLTQCQSRIVLERTSQWDDGSDHVCLVGTPIDVEAAPDFTPLRLSGAAGIDAGHDADERATPVDLNAGGERPANDASSMDDPTLQDLENIAAGAGHAVDLGRPDPPVNSQE